MSAPPSGPPPPYGDSAYPPASGYPPQPPPQQGYGPPPAGYPQPGPYPPGPQPGQGQGPTMVVTQPTIVTTTVVQQRLGDGPSRTHCPHCQADIVTAVEYSSGLLAWLIAGGLCLFGCWLGCCLIPFCVDGCKDVSHSCPNCKQFISRHSRL